MKFFFVFLVFASIIFVNSQFSGCRRDSRCIPLKQCPVLREWLKSRSQRMNLLNKICGFIGRKIKVCCPAETNTFKQKEKVQVQVQAKADKVNKAAKMKLLPYDLCGKPSSDDKIFGGTVAPIGAYPWMVALGYHREGLVKFDCAGSLINSRYVLTAAHCIKPAEPSVLHLGDHNLDTNVDCHITSFLNIRNCAPPHITRGVEKMIPHEAYNTRKQFSDDVALIRMDKPIDFLTVNSNVAPICIPPSNLRARDATRGQDTIAAGWGYMKNRTKSHILLRVNLPLVEESECKRVFGEQFLPEQICVGGVVGKDTCGGDSGGPLIVAGPYGPPFLQIGIVSYGKDCGKADTPAVYASVSHYYDWILEKIEP